MAPLRSSLSRIPLGRALIALGLILVAINIGAAIWDVRKAHDRTESRAKRDFSNMTRLLAEQTAASLDSVDLILRALQGKGIDETVAMAPKLRDELDRIPHIAALSVFNAQGQLVLLSSNIPAFDPEVAERPYFVAHRDGKADLLHLSEPYRVGPGGQWRVMLSRRLSGPDGAFAGVVATAIDLEVFDRLYKAIDLGDGGFITLLSNKGTLITRVPDPGNARGRKFPGGRIMSGIDRAGHFAGWVHSPITDEQVLLATSAVRGFPLLVASGANEGAVLAPWRDEAWLVFDRTLLTSAAMLGLIALAAWGLARRERALSRSWKRYQAMIEHSADALILSRPTAGGILYASPAMERVLGFNLEDLRGREVMDFIHPEFREMAMQLRTELLRVPGKVSVDECKVSHKDGSWRWVELTRKNLLHEPSVRAVVFNFRDITERKQAEAERARLEQRLRQAEKMEAVGRLAGGIAHDFNNILGGILGYAEMLAEKAPPGSPLKRYADNVLSGATRASGLVEQILSYSRSQRGKRAPVDLGRVVTETLELVRGSLPAGISLHYEVGPERAYVVGDATQLHQVTMNLCTNACHAMPAGGTLRVKLETAKVAADRQLAHTVLHAGDYACLTVEDTGTGMDEATLARIFEPFFTTKEVGKGTGLGLALVYGIVTDSAGAIDVVSTPGRGSRFAIYLPRVEEEEMRPAAGDDASPLARGQGERVLVVDDEEALVAVTSEVLKHIGYEPVGCSDGAAALAAFDSGHIDAVIADEVMPGMSGTQLATALRRKRADLPIVLVSGYTGPILTERALGAGVTEILKKPVQSREIARALARVLHSARASTT
ncbi:MAG TPA: PAS domain S-box protein [Burkholderiales bacterium]|nr:PAS domain S-box protein [Burkholderiales bacterium]